MHKIVFAVACIGMCMCACSLTDVTCGENAHLYNGGCEENTPEHCGTHEKDCTAFAGVSEMACMDKHCVAQACEVGYHLEDVDSEDKNRDIACILDTVEACGADPVDCAKHVSQWVDGTCEKGVCMPTVCEADYHVAPDGLGCESDTAGGCGKDNADCMREGVADAECIGGKCSAQACVVGYHRVEKDGLGECVADTAHACGASMVDCSTRPGWKDGKCQDGQCYVEVCEREYYLSEDERVCEPNDAKHCGYEEKVDCIANEGWVVSDCVNGECKALGCAESYHLKESNCVKDTPEACGVQEIDCTSLKGWDGAQTSCDGGRCSVGGCVEGFRLSDSSDDKLNGKTCTSNMEAACGPQEVDCTATVPGWETGSCNEGVCVPETCVVGYHMDENGACVVDDTEHCGGVERNCREILGVHEVACVEGKCSISACLADYHLEDHEPDAYVAEKICVADSVDACGPEMVKCEESITGWRDGVCEHAVCRPTSCILGMHLSADNTKCEADTVSACGAYDYDCVANNEGWEAASCLSGKCYLRTCISDYYKLLGVKPSENKCVKKDVKHCGKTGNLDCTKKDGWTEGSCINSKCEPSNCDVGYYLNSNTKKCTPSDENNCGTQGYVCKEKIAQWSTGNCVNNVCKLGKCVAGYHVYGNACERNNIDNCGSHGYKCSAHVSQWANGECPDGLCNLTSCNSGYHVYGASCEKDSQSNCGKHGNVCAVSWYTFLTGIPSVCSNGKCT